MNNNNAYRDQAIAIARRHGMSYACIGRAHGISRERVRQILAEKVDPMARELSARLRNAIEAENCPVMPAAVARRFTYTDLKRVPNLGVKSIAELNAWLIRNGQKPITEKRKRT